MLEGRVDLIGEAVTRAARAGAERATALNHEIGNHAVKIQSIVVRLTGFAALGLKFLGPFGQTHKVSHRQRCFLKLQLQVDDTFGGFEPGIKAVGQFVRCRGTQWE